MECAFDPVSFEKWIRRNYFEDRKTPRTPNPNVELIGKTQPVTCAKCGFKHDLPRIDPWVGDWICSKCRGYKK